jgi:hypothetical protein
VLFKQTSDGYQSYGCTLYVNTDKHFGNAVVAETDIGNGLDEYAGRPLDAVRVLVINFDQLVDLGVIPGTARTISPSLPRYLLAAGAVGGILIGTAVLYLAGRRAGRATAAHRARRDRATDSRTMLSAATAVVAQQIIDLDSRYATAVKPFRSRPGADGAAFAGTYRDLMTEYGRLLDDVAAADRRGQPDFTHYTRRAEALTAKLRALAG